MSQELLARLFLHFECTSISQTTAPALMFSIYSRATTFQFIIDEQLVVLSRLLSAIYRPVGCDVGSLKPTSPNLLWAWAWAHPRTQTHTQTHMPSRILTAGFGRQQSPECAMRCSIKQLNGGKRHATSKQASSSICRRSPDPPARPLPRKGWHRSFSASYILAKPNPPPLPPSPVASPVRPLPIHKHGKYIFGPTLQRTPRGPHSMISAPLYSPSQGVG